MDWVGVLSCEFVEEEEMFMLAIGFVARMRKRTMDSENEPAPYLMGSVLGGLRKTKGLRRNGQ